MKNIKDFSEFKIENLNYINGGAGDDPTEGEGEKNEPQRPPGVPTTSTLEPDDD